MGRRANVFTQGDCPECGQRCKATDQQPDAHRMWAQRHADRTGHVALVESTKVRAYEPSTPPASGPPTSPPNRGGGDRG